MSARQAAVIVDYQNVHLRGRERFCGERPLHECLISPGAFARRLLDVRAAAGRGRAELAEVQVFRGLPEPEYDLAGYQRNLAQQCEWETAPLVTVTHRPLRYRVVQQRYSTGPGPALQSDVEARGKGIDVLCALAVISAVDRFLGRKPRYLWRGDPILSVAGRSPALKEAEPFRRCIA